MIGSAYATAFYLKNEVQLKKKVFVIGMEGIIEELTLAGIECCPFEVKAEKSHNISSNKKKFSHRTGNRFAPRTLKTGNPTPM